MFCLYHCETIQANVNFPQDIRYKKNIHIIVISANEAWSGYYFSSSAGNHWLGISEFRQLGTGCRASMNTS